MIIFRKSTKDPQSLLDPTGNSGLMTILWNHRKNILRNNCFAGSMAQQVRVDQPRWKWKDLSLNKRSAAIIINSMIQWLTNEQRHLKRGLFFYFWHQSTSVSAASTPGLDSWRPWQLQGEQSGEGGGGETVDCPQLWVFPLSHTTWRSSCREELRNVAEMDGGGEMEEKLKQGQLLPQVKRKIWNSELSALYRMKLLALWNIF